MALDIFEQSTETFFPTVSECVPYPRGQIFEPTLVIGFQGTIRVDCKRSATPRGFAQIVCSAGSEQI